MSINIDILLKTMIIKKASDLYLQPDTPPIFRILGEMLFSDLPPMNEKDIEKFVFSLLTPEQKELFEKKHHIVTATSVSQVARLRLTAFKQREHLNAIIRPIPIQVPTISELKLPKTLGDLALLPNGLILVTGPANNGKTTTLASMLNQINLKKRVHIITLEDPIEFLHTNKASVINQKQFRQDTEDSFATSLKDISQETPNVVMVSSLKDPETIREAIRISQTGCLVLAGIDAADSINAIESIINIFPPEEQEEIIKALLTSLKAVIAQATLNRKDGSGKIPVIELIKITTGISNLIKDKGFEKIRAAVKNSNDEEMVLFEDALVPFRQQDLISLEEIKNKIIGFTEKSS